jgi:flagellar biosynthesis protein FlhG
VVFSNMAKVAKRFLKVSLDFMGFVPQEEKIHRATQLGRTVVDAFPDSTAAQAFRDLAEKMEQWPHPAGEQGQMEAFMQRLVQSSRATAAEPSRTGRA